MQLDLNDKVLNELLNQMSQLQIKIENRLNDLYKIGAFSGVCCQMRCDIYINIKEIQATQLKRIKNKPSFKWLRILNVYFAYTKEEFKDVMEIDKKRNTIIPPKEFQGIDDFTTDGQYEFNKYREDLNFLMRNEDLFLENIKIQ